MLANFSLVTEILGNVFTTFIFQKFLSHQALMTGKLQLPVTIKGTFLRSYKGQYLFGWHRQLRLSPKQIVANVISRFKSFSLNEYDLLLLSSVFVMEMFDLRGKELKYAKELLLNHYRKSIQNSMRLQDMWVELKL